MRVGIRPGQRCKLLSLAISLKRECAELGEIRTCNFVRDALNENTDMRGMYRCVRALDYCITCQIIFASAFTRVGFCVYISSSSRIDSFPYRRVEGIPRVITLRNLLQMFTRQPVTIHPSSTLHSTKPKMVLFTELVATSKYYLRGVSVIEPEWLTEKHIHPARRN